MNNLDEPVEFTPTIKTDLFGWSDVSNGQLDASEEIPPRFGTAVDLVWQMTYGPDWLVQVISSDDGVGVISIYECIANIDSDHRRIFSCYVPLLNNAIFGPDVDEAEDWKDGSISIINEYNSRKM